MFLGTVLWCAYHFLFEWLSGKTLGKEIMAIEVLASNREKCRSGRAFVRNLLRPIDAFGFYLLGFLVALFSSSNQRIGDRVAGTIVWENSSARRKLAALAWLVANILLAYAAVLLVRLAR
jgi:uncharacterized RDD family membrane protein YckC